MTAVPAPLPVETPPMYGWRRLALALGMATVLGILISPSYVASVSVWQVIGREMVLGMAALTVFGIFERWPRHLPFGMARWSIQVIAVALVIPPTVILIYIVITAGDAIPFYKAPNRINGIVTMISTGLLVAPWAAVSALFSQRDVAARNLELAKSELERQTLDARLRMVQAHIEPHFLFNTLANVRELVVSGSPQAATVLDSLIAYLRAAVPRLGEAQATMDQELQLVRSYLELMQMRMPDRLQYSVHADDGALKLRCPPTTLLTLVENDLRHGIDPSEDGGRIDVRVTVTDGRCRAEVSDTGGGLRTAGEGPGTGLASLRERLKIVFGESAQVRIANIVPHGVRAEADFPAVTAG